MTLEVGNLDIVMCKLMLILISNIVIQRQTEAPSGSKIMPYLIIFDEVRTPGNLDFGKPFHTANVIPTFPFSLTNKCAQHFVESKCSDFKSLGKDESLKVMVQDFEVTTYIFFRVEEGGFEFCSLNKKIIHQSIN